MSIKLTLSLRTGASECLRWGRGGKPTSDIGASVVAPGCAPEGPASELVVACSDDDANDSATAAALLGSTCMASGTRGSEADRAAGRATPLLPIAAACWEAIADAESRPTDEALQ